jgi:hypothetical protein
MYRVDTVIVKEMIYDIFVRFIRGRMLYCLKANVTAFSMFCYVNT